MISSHKRSSSTEIWGWIPSGSLSIVSTAQTPSFKEVTTLYESLWWASLATNVRFPKLGKYILWYTPHTYPVTASMNWKRDNHDQPRSVACTTMKTLTSTSAFLIITGTGSGFAPVERGIPRKARTSFFGGARREVVMKRTALMGVLAAVYFRTAKLTATIWCTIYC